jgi:integrase
MASIFARPGSKYLWAKFSDAEGKVHRVSLKTADPKEAAFMLEVLEKPPPPPPPEGTVSAFVEGEWSELRRISAPAAITEDLSKLRFHFLDSLGERPLTWLSTEEGKRALFQWAIALKTHVARRDKKPLAPRSVWNVFFSVRGMLDDAVELQRLALNPLASFKPGKYLPEKTDKVVGWRQNAGFDLAQVISLCTDQRLRPHRRVLNALAFLTGGRPGEVSELRWKDWMPVYKDGPLGRLTLSRAWNSSRKTVKGTKTGAVKIVPAHPLLAGILSDWQERGFEEWTGRAPTPDDLICPRPDLRPFNNCSLLDHFHLDLGILGLPLQRAYESRSTFRNLLLQVGAQEFHVNLMTHAPAKQGSDYYTRLEMQWPAMCEAILKLKLGTAAPAKAQFSDNHKGISVIHESLNRGSLGILLDW